MTYLALLGSEEDVPRRKVLVNLLHRSFIPGIVVCSDLDGNSLCVHEHNLKPWKNAIPESDGKLGVEGSPRRSALRLLPSGQECHVRTYQQSNQVSKGSRSTK